MVRWGMVIDLKRCIGCNTCTMACRMENATPPGIRWAYVLQSEVGKYPNARMVFLPMLCMQCRNPPCVYVCPTGASYQREDGIVMVDYDKCMGCRYCTVACPYEARHYVEKLETYYEGKPPTPFEVEARKDASYKRFRKGVSTKCTFCVSLVEKGKQPACVANCIGLARFFGDLDDPESEVSQLIARKHAVPLKPELGTEPAVYYIPP